MEETFRLPPLPVRLRRCVDVNMADPEPVAITRGAAMAGKKRSRDEDEEEDGFSFGERFEKVCRLLMTANFHADDSLESPANFRR